MGARGPIGNVQRNPQRCPWALPNSRILPEELIGNNCRAYESPAHLLLECDDMPDYSCTTIANYAETSVAEKQKPAKNLASNAARALKTGTASKKTVKSMAARILADEKNDPEPHKRGPKAR
jgi:hypothetical protein